MAICLVALLVPPLVGHPPSSAAFTALVTLAAGLLGHLVGRREDALRALSAIDPLTGLANRRLFEQNLQRELARSARNHQPLAMLVIDLDSLKAINDVLGHSAGDRAICAVGEALRHSCRATDLAARWGGDEFVVVAPATTEQQARALAERIIATVHLRSAARQPLVELGSPEKAPGISVSIGVAAASPDQPALMRTDALFAAADRALYQAKLQGPGRVQSAGGDGRCVVRAIKSRAPLHLVMPGAHHSAAGRR